MARLTSEKYQERKDLIIREGIKLFMAKGYNATSVKDITQAAGIPKGSFFNYFDTKESYAAETIEFNCKESIPWYRSVLLDESKSPVKRIQVFYRMRIHLFCDVLEYKQGCMLNGMSQEMADRSDLIADSLRDSFSILRKEIENTLWLAQEAGEISSDHDPSELALFVENSYRGALVVAKSMQNEQPFQAFKNYLNNYILK